MNLNQFQQNPKKIETMMRNSFLTAFKMYLNDFDRLINVRRECVEYLTKSKETLGPFAVIMLNYLETFIKKNCEKKDNTYERGLSQVLNDEEKKRKKRLKYMLNPNLSLIKKHYILHQKITILTSTVVVDGDNYHIQNEFKKIEKANYGENTSCHIQANYEDIIVSNDLKKKENILYYDCDFISHARKCKGTASEEKKLTEDMPKLHVYVNNARFRISQRIFGKKPEYFSN